MSQAAIAITVHLMWHPKGVMLYSRIPWRALIPPSWPITSPRITGILALPRRLSMRHSQASFSRNRLVEV